MSTLHGARWRDLVRNAAEQEAFDSAQTAIADDDQLCVLFCRHIGEHLRRVTLAGDGLHLDVGVCLGGGPDEAAARMRTWSATAPRWTRSSVPLLGMCSLYGWFSYDY